MTAKPLEISSSTSRRRNGELVEAKLVCRHDGGIMSLKFRADGVRVYASGFDISPDQWREVLAVAAGLASLFTDGAS